MRTLTQGNTFRIWLSKVDTYDWAHRPGASWPCSTLAGKSVFAEFRHGDLVDFQVSGKWAPDGIDGHEFNCMIDDFKKGESNE